MPKVTVIIPVYNSEKYLHRCVDSVLNQTLDDIEIILVDDGSTDHSKNICDDYNRRHENVKVFHKENGGASSARNIGLDNATGEYIGFVDSDDYISLDMYEKLFRICKEQQCDIAMCNYQTVKNNKTISVGEFDFPVDLRESHEEIRKLMEMANDGEYLWFNWNKIYKSNVIQKNNIRFNTELLCGEDSPFNMEAILCSDSMVYFDEPLYYYEQSDDSIQRSKHKHNYLKKLEKLYDVKMDILSKHQINGFSNICRYTMTHTLPLLFENELHYKRKINEKICIYKKTRNSRMIDEAMKNSNPGLINSRLKYLAILLKYRCYFLLALITN